MDLNAALDNVQQAAMINIRVSQLPRLQRQPEVITNFEPGDLALRDPRTNTGATRLLSNKLEPLRHGPYLVVEQERTVQISRIQSLYVKSMIWLRHIASITTLCPFSSVP